MATNPALQQAASRKLAEGTMPNGSYPIRNQHQADSAWNLRGHSKDYSEAQVVAHIRQRVSALGLKMPTNKDS